jgi:hypothetical protein
LPPAADGRPPLAAVRSGLGDLLRRHPAAGPERHLEPLRWAITAVDPVLGLRIEGVLLITAASA